MDAFSKIQPISAKDFFGSKWKKVLLETMSQDQLVEKSIMHGNKPLDCNLCVIHTRSSQRYKTGSKILLETNENKYPNEYTVLFSDVDKAGKLIINEKFTENCTGTILFKEAKIIEIEQECNNEQAQIININSKNVVLSKRNQSAQILRIVAACGLILLTIGILTN